EDFVMVCTVQTLIRVSRWALSRMVGRQSADSAADSLPRSEKTMTIRAVLLSLLGVLGLLVAGFAGINVYQAIAAYRMNSAFLDADQAAELLLKGASGLAMERGLGNAPLHAPNAMPADKRDEVRRVGASADDSLREGFRRLRLIPAMVASLQAID